MANHPLLGQTPRENEECGSRRLALLACHSNENGALLIAMYAAGNRANQALAKLVGKQESSLSEAFLAQLRDVSQTKGDNTTRDLWELLAHLQFKGLRGPRFKGRTRALFLDSILLFGCPNGFIHLLRDDLVLRLEEDTGSQQRPLS